MLCKFYDIIVARKEALSSCHECISNSKWSDEFKFMTTTVIFGLKP